MNKCTIFYFSGTGNTLIVAKKLTEKLKADIVPIKSLNSAKATVGSDAIGIVFPVYMFGLPLIVKRLAETFSADNKPYIFGVATYGGMPGNSLGQLADILKSRGLMLSGGFGVRMPGNYTPLYGAISVEKQKEMFIAADTKIDKIACDVLAGRSAPIEKSNFIINLIFFHFLYRFASPRIPEMDKKFRATVKCNHCNICEKICPVNNIEMVNALPAWRHKCEQCMACLQWCPTEAIEYGKATEGRKRYHHPDVKIDDLL